MKYLMRFNESKAPESFKDEFKDFCEGGLAFILDNGEISYDFSRWVNTNICNVEIRLDEAQDWLDVRDYFIPFFERLNANYDISGPIEIATKIADNISSMQNYLYDEVVSGELKHSEPRKQHWSQKENPMASFMDKKYKDKAIVSTIRFKILSKSVNETMTYDEKYDEVLDRCLDLIDLGFDFKLNDGSDYTINYDFKDRKMLASFNKSEKRNIDTYDDDNVTLSDIATNYKKGSLYVYDNGDCIPGAYDGLSKDELIKTKDRQDLLEAVTECLFRLKGKFNRVMGYIHFSYQAVRNPYDFQISHIILKTEVRFYVDKSNPVLVKESINNNGLIPNFYEDNLERYKDLREYCDSSLAFLLDEGYTIEWTDLYDNRTSFPTSWLFSIRKPDSAGNNMYRNQTFVWSDVKDELLRFVYLIRREYKLEDFTNGTFRLLLPKELRGTRTTTPTMDLSYEGLEKLEDNFQLSAFCVKIKL